MPEKRRKSVDELFCRYCGERIKKDAEICPHCGSRNEKPTAPPPERASSGPASEKTTSGTASSSHRSTPQQSTHHQSAPQQSATRQYETSVSEKWWYGVAGGTALWAFVIVLASVFPDGLGALGGFLVLLAWFGLPLAAYFDMQYVRANSEWRPSTALWVVLLAVWLVNIVVGAAYLHRRREALREP